MHPPAFLRRRAPRRALLSLAAAALAVSACGSSGGAASATPVSTASTASATPVSTASTASATSTTAAPTPTVPPSALPLAALIPLWRSTGPASAKASFQALAVDPRTGETWASVPFENRFWIFTPGGQYHESWGTAGSGPGQFDLNDHLQNPDGFGAIAFAPDGTFYVGDVGNHRMEKFDASRHFVMAWGKFGSDDGQFAQITAVATDGKTVYVGDGGRGDIQAFDANGAHLRTFGAAGSFAAFVAIDQAGNAYATNPSTGAPAVAKFDPEGKQVARFDMSSIGDAVGVAVDPQGNIFVAAASTNPPYRGVGTYELGPDGRVLHGWSIVGGGYIALSTNGDTLYVSGWTWPYIEAYAVPKG